MDSQDIGCPENLKGWGLVEEGAPWGHEFEGLTPVPALPLSCLSPPLPGSPLHFCYGLLLWANNETAFRVRPQKP